MSEASFRHTYNAFARVRFARARPLVGTWNLGAWLLFLVFGGPWTAAGKAAQLSATAAEAEAETAAKTRSPLKRRK